MKTPLFLIVLLFNTSAFARIGETTEQLTKRYGRPLKIIRNNLESRRYSFHGFTILVGLEGGISQCEIYQKEDNSRMAEAEIQNLLQANAGRSEWRSEPEENASTYVYWSRDKKTRVAIYTLTGHTLTVTSKAGLSRCAQLGNSSDRKEMPGF